MTPSRLPDAAGLARRAKAPGGLLLVAGVLAGCAALMPGSPDPPPETAAERARRDQLEASYRQLDEAHQRVLREQALVVQENQRLLREQALVVRETQRLREETQRLQRERQTLQDAARRRAAGSVSEEEVARLRLQLLERDAQIKLLTQKVDAAILEVVRAMAKLRSLESKAEAATNLAEAEIAVTMLERATAGRDKDPDAVQAGHFLKLGAEEFRKDNYSGALYLSTQTKSLIKGSQPGPVGGERTPKLEGEVPFALPLPLRLLARGEAREGPGPNFKVAFLLPDGTPVTAQSYKGLWVRVRGDDGRSGWVRYNLVGHR